MKTEHDINMAIQIDKSQMVGSIYSSAGIEGLSVTFPQTMCILDGAPVNMDANTMLFILNMRDAWKFLLDNLNYPINLMFVRELNKICGDKIIYGCGTLRTVNVSIGASTYVPPIPKYEDVVNSLSAIYSICDPVQKSLVAFCYLAKQQLFIDGNKRVAQLVANKILIENGVGILQLPYTDRISFIEYLVNYYETADGRNLCNFLVSKCIQWV